MAGSVSTHRHNVVLPAALHRELNKLAKRKGQTTSDLIRKALKLGLLVMEVDDDPDAELFIRENGAERKILIV